MRILHTSDWHLGKKLEGFSRLDEQKAVLDEICDIADQNNVDAVIIAGDLFDNFNPSGEAVELFYHSLKKIARDGERPVVAIAGNHDAPERIEAPDPLARECGIIFSGNPDTLIAPLQLNSGLQITKTDHGFIEMHHPNWSFPLRIILTPYANEFRLKTFLGIKDPESSLRNILEQNWQNLAFQYCDNKGVNILVTHLFMMEKGKPLQEEPESEKPILHIGGAQPVYTENIPDNIQYVALGHLHQQQMISENPVPVAYCGSPLSYSFSEAGHEKYVMLLDINPDQKPRIQPHKLTRGKPLYRKKFEDINQAVDWLHENPDCWVELTLVIENYLQGSDRKKIYETHNGIVNIIPELKTPVWPEEPDNKKIDLQKDRETLFKKYFRYREGYEPDTDLINLFREMVANDQNTSHNNNSGS